MGSREDGVGGQARVFDVRPADGERHDRRRLDESPNAAGSLQVTLDVCRDDQFIWFDPGELDQLPEDLPDPQPSAAEVVEIDRITTVYERELDAAYEDDSLLGRFADRVSSGTRDS